MVDRIGRGTARRRRKREKRRPSRSRTRRRADLNSQERWQQRDGRIKGREEETVGERKEEDEEEEEKRKLEGRKSDEFSTHAPKPSALISSQFR